MDRLLPAVVAALERAAAAARHPRAQRSAGARCSKGSSSGSRCSPARCPRRVTVARERRSSTTSICGAGRRPGCSSISARTARRRRATRAAGCSTASATTAASRCALARALHGDDRVRHLRGRGRAACAPNAARNGVAVDARVGNVFDELRGLERLGERFDTIVLDPPAFAKNKAAVAEGARRLQGDQPARAEAAQPGRHAGHLQLLVQRQRGGVRRDRLRGGGRRAGAGDGRREADAGARSPGAARRAGDLLPEVLHPAEARVMAAPTRRPALQRRATRAPQAARRREARAGAPRPAGRRLRRQPLLPRRRPISASTTSARDAMRALARSIHAAHRERLVDRRRDRVRRHR